MSNFMFVILIVVTSEFHEMIQTKDHHKSEPKPPLRHFHNRIRNRFSRDVDLRKLQKEIRPLLIKSQNVEPKQQQENSLSKETQTQHHHEHEMAMRDVPRGSVEPTKHGHRAPPPPFPPHWTPWSRWSTCSVECGVGKSVRRRRCKSWSPSSSTQHPPSCLGPSSSSRPCLAPPCDERDVAARVETLEGRATALECRHRIEREEEGDLELIWITPRGKRIKGGSSSSSKYRLQGDQLLLSRVEASDSGRFGCVLVKKSSGEIVETTIAELIVKGCESKPCLNGGTCVETVEDEGASFSFSCECPPSYEGEFCDVENSFWFRFVVVVFVVGGVVVAGSVIGCALVFFVKAQRSPLFNPSSSVENLRKNSRRGQSSSQAEEQPLLLEEEPLLIEQEELLREEPPLLIQQEEQPLFMEQEKPLLLLKQEEQPLLMEQEEPPLLLQQEEQPLLMGPEDLGQEQEKSVLSLMEENPSLISGEKDAEAQLIVTIESVTDEEQKSESNRNQESEIRKLIMANKNRRRRKRSESEMDSRNLLNNDSFYNSNNYNNNNNNDCMEMFELPLVIVHRSNEEEEEKEEEEGKEERYDRSKLEKERKESDHGLKRRELNREKKGLKSWRRKEEMFRWRWDHEDESSTGEENQLSGMLKRDWHEKERRLKEKWKGEDRTLKSHWKEEGTREKEKRIEEDPKEKEKWTEEETLTEEDWTSDEQSSTSLWKTEDDDGDDDEDDDDEDDDDDDSDADDLTLTLDSSLDSSFGEVSSDFDSNISLL